MKKRIANVLQYVVVFDFIWKWVTVVAMATHRIPGQTRCFQFLLYLKFQISKDFIAQQTEILCPKRQVTRGPFAGLTYPSDQTIGSSLMPKLLGCYESEISDVVSGLLSHEYHHVHNIGCAEGYYAIGFALNSLTTKVTAYDISPVQRRRCREMAIVNGVSDRVDIRSACTREDLLKIDRKQRNLIVSDCEGGEMQLLTDQIAAALKGSDFLIEVHERHGASLETLTKVMSEHHDVQILWSLPDLDKALHTTNPAMQKYPLSQRVLLLAELRSVRMPWIIAHTRQQGNISVTAAL